MSDEYDLSEAGMFTELELLDFNASEQEKGRTVRKIWITKRQENYLANSIHKVKPKKTGKYLVDFWNEPLQQITLTSVHGIEIGIDND